MVGKFPFKRIIPLPYFTLYIIYKLYHHSSLIIIIKYKRFFQLTVVHHSMSIYNRIDFVYLYIVNGISFFNILLPFVITSGVHTIFTISFIRSLSRCSHYIILLALQDWQCRRKMYRLIFILTSLNNKSILKSLCYLKTFKFCVRNEY